MQRVPEPALMNAPEQAAAYAGGDLDNAYWLFVQLFHKYFPNLVPNDTILDLGCGPAAIPLRLAKLFRNCQIHCVDGAAQMLEQGQHAAQREGLQEQVHFFHGKLPDKLPLPHDRYNIVISNSFLHHLADPMILWNAIHRYSLPGAAILIVDLLRPTSDDRAQMLVDQYLPDAHPLLRQDMLLSLGAAFTLDEVKTQLQQASLTENLSLAMATPFQFVAYGYLEPYPWNSVIDNK
ncbi:MAG: ubiquinone/menaquinone biosynthesis C-methylase UbiE [Desulforhopalus sp.]|jgi:ubiquinone/menaquinone biosynthesis C-methylase UbiE